MENKKVLESLRKQAGYTLDQTILIVAIIAILITLIIMTVGWDLINRASGTKLSGHMRQVEEAVGLFYSRFGQWPDQALESSGATASGAVANVRILQQDIFGSTATGRYSDKHTNLLSGFDQDSSSQVVHGFGAGGVIQMERLAGDSVSSDKDDSDYLVISFDNVPIDEAMEADEAVDGEEGFGRGRLVIVSNGSGCDSGAVSGRPTNVTVCYMGNLVE